MDEKKRQQEIEAQAAAPAQNTAQTGEERAQTAAAPAAGVTGGAQYQPPKLPETGYTSPYDGQLQELYKSITERKPFSYDADDDAMYQQYRDRYMQLGQDAMRDTMGQAAALTGGYGSTYAQGAGQQAYERYMLGLNDKANELAEAAYGRWQDEGDRARQEYAMLGDLAERDYDQWADAYSREMQRYALGADEAAQRAEFGDMSGIAALYGDDAASGARWQYAAENPDVAFRSGVITGEEYYVLTGRYPLGYTPEGWGAAGGGSSGVSGKDYDNGNLTTEQVKEMQRALGVKADGLWGARSSYAATAGTNEGRIVSADEAWEHFKNR